MTGLRRRVPAYALAALVAIVMPAGAADQPAGPPVHRVAPADVPIVAGMRVVLAVNDATPPSGKDEGIVQGDYEMVVEISEVGDQQVTQTAFIDGTDAGGIRRRGSIPRVVSAADLAGSHVQVFGFHSSDPQRVSGTTSLGPSLKVTRELRQAGETAYSFLNFVSRGMVSGTLRRSAASPVKFPVLLNGKRVVLDAIHATGTMSLGGVSRPFETVILDHPRYPLSLRIAYGPRDATFPFAPDFLREIVRIDLPAAQAPIAETLAQACRVEVPGLYFDFNQATLKPESAPALRELAAVLQRLPERRFSIEGHTDSIGSDRYNDDLSARRAAAVKTALMRDFGVDAARLAAKGHGERRPIETNDTLAGRARNRRVELVCAGGPEAPPSRSGAATGP
jgi:outer membrane protein OmpA-like peptidoglycan-associated protein